MHGVALGSEYTFRYNKKHASSRVIDHCVTLAQGLDFPSFDLTPFAQVVKDHTCADPVLAYRKFYLVDKASFAKWRKGRPAPYWWPA
jgi:hypothetical protein